MRDNNLELERTGQLIEALKTHGLRATIRDGWGDEAEYRKATKDDWHTDITVLNKSGQVCALVKMKTTRGWASRFESWKLHLPTYQPRGDYNIRENARDPADPNHWGFGNIKSAGDVVTKIVAAMPSLPGAADIEIGKLRRKLDKLQYEDRDAVSQRRYAFRDLDVTEEIAAILNNGDIPMSKRMRSALKDYNEARGTELRLKEKRRKIYDKIGKLEERS